ncbi:Poxvirus protein I5 [Pseudarthrobacter sp. NIBRBAC000502772]|uniref:Poxvirus protein I5 n=1 Tax=Pseudarthrobacter sp. NIBRBAC000502772 TaxID=2590775 RepID=UPI001131ED79|nr:Poxvirus protein I5 [Pseudarthrobacter sp. NIBRBAC000502772]QDG68214.1 Poxvirus protein I5 [Pseudarthrobacter sp. NIBRBAC000502772]
MSIMDSTTPASGRNEPIPVNRFALFSETLLAGLLVLVLSIPLVTIPAAYAAGIAHLERHLAGRDDSLRGLWGTFRAALPGSWKLGITTAGAGVVIVLNLLLATVGQLPGSSVVLPATLILAAAGAVLLLRTAAAWSGVAWSDVDGEEASAPGAWSAALDTAKALSLRDWTGSLLLAAALFASVVFVWMLVALFVVVPGMLILASAAVKMRSSRA